jgi:hypothetical protein
MADNVRKREWLDAEEVESGGPGLPRPDLNPLVNPLLSENMGRWAQVYFTSPANQREQAVERLLQELKAESGNKKPAGFDTTRDSAPVPKAPKSRPELEFPQLSIPASAHEPPELIPFSAGARIVPDLVACPACRHKNPAEQRFCGICGNPLAGDVEVRESRPAPPTTAQPTRPMENAESDWSWLRERTLATYEPRSDSGNHSRALFVVLALVIIAIGGYFGWQNRDRIMHVQPTSSPALASQPAALPAMNLPIAAEPAAPSAPQRRIEKAATTLPAVKASPHVAVEDKSTAASDSSAVSSSDDGGDELARARQFLAGEGVPRNSWMASQLLWKAIGKQNSEAVLLLSDLYARGDGVPRSCEQARILLVSAAKKGSPAAAQKLRSIEAGCR